MADKRESGEQPQRPLAQGTNPAPPAGRPVAAESSLVPETAVSSPASPPESPGPDRPHEHIFSPAEHALEPGPVGVRLMASREASARAQQKHLEATQRCPHCAGELKAHDNDDAHALHCHSALCNNCCFLPAGDQDLAERPGARPCPMRRAPTVL